MGNKRKWLIYILSAVLACAVAWFLYHYREKLGKILWPFFLAVILAYLLRPLVVRMENRKIPRTAGILILYLFFSVFIATLVVFVVPEIVDNTKDLINTLPDIAMRYQNMLNGVVSLIQSSNWSVEVKNVLFREIQNSTEIAQSYIVNTLRRAMNGLVETVTMLFDLVLAMIIAYYFIKDTGLFKAAALSLIPRRWRNGLIGTGREINGILSNFIQGQLLTALIVGTMEAAGLFAVRVKYPIVLGLLGGIANIIPYFGPIIGAIPAVAVALLESPVKALWAVLVFVIVQQIDNAFISPKIIEGKLGLHPVTTILAVLVGGEFFGILGMLLAVPVTAMLKVILKRLVEAVV